MIYALISIDEFSLFRLTRNKLHPSSQTEPRLYISSSPISTFVPANRAPSHAKRQIENGGLDVFPLINLPYYIQRIEK